ncbi:MAG: phage terminase large subunit family protein [Deltaproteobacteria bacterium]|nr:phage terminase large subunit family protein [Deltaproteobacteria bacterium]
MKAVIDPAISGEQVRHDVGRGEAVTYSFRFSDAERKIYRKRKHMPVSKWCERHRVITMGRMPGKWKNEITPCLAGIMDASFFPSVETTIVCAADQGGKSESVNNCIGYAIDRDPGPTLFVYPDEQTAKENSKDRILPMIQSSPRLRTYLSGTVDDEAALRINLKHMPIYMAWARSASRLANKPIKYIVFDETDKYPPTAGKREADPISKGEKRLRTYRHNRKIWKLSTPTIETGPIWAALTKEAQVIFIYEVCCPDCGMIQRMVFEQIKWPEGERDPENVELKELAWYECIRCKSKWNDLKRDVAVRWGRWRSMEAGETIGDYKEDRSGEGERSGLELIKYLRKYRPSKIGFHMPSWLSHFVGLSEAAAAFLRGLKDKIKLKDFNNSHAAIPWTDWMAERKEDKILILKDDRPEGLVPSGGIVSCLTAGVDTQKYGFWYEVRAWGWGMTQESWQVRCGFVDSIESIEQVLFKEEYLDSDGKEYFVRFAVHDAMGGRTAEIYDFARMHRGRLAPFKGEQNMAQPHKFGKIDTYPGTNKMIPGGIMLLRANVTYFKNQLANKLEISPADPGAWHMNADMPDEWAMHMCAEYVNDKGFWENPPSKANHGWDCSVYNLVAANVLRVKFKKKEKAEEKTKKRRVISKGM